jgi:hypothetical protein
VIGEMVLQEDQDMQLQAFIYVVEENIEFII